MRRGAGVTYRCRWCGTEFAAAHVPDANLGIMIALGVREPPGDWFGTIELTAAHYHCSAADPVRIGIADLVGFEVDPPSPAPEAPR